MSNEYFSLEDIMSHRNIIVSTVDMVLQVKALELEPNDFIVPDNDRPFTILGLIDPISVHVHRAKTPRGRIQYTTATLSLTLKIKNSIEF